MRHLVAMKGKPMKPAKDRRRKSSNRSSTQIVPITSKQRKPEKSWKSTLEALKATQKPYRGLNQLARPADTRRKIQDMSDVGRAQKAKETDGGTRCMSSTRWSEFSGTGRGVSKNCQRRSVQDSCVPSVLSPQQTVDQICSTDRHMSDDILRTMFQGWHEHQRGHKVPRCNHRFETRAITKTHVGPLASCSQGMAQLGSRNLSPTRSLAGGSTSGIQDGGGQQGDPCPVHPNYVCNVLPSFRTSTTPKKGPSGIKGPWHSVVASPEQVRGHGAVKNRHARREHDPRQQRNPLVRYDAEDDCHKTDIQPPFQHRLHELRESWKKALKSASLPDGYMVIYQLRHSGASWDRSKGYRSQLEVKHRGRWASDTSMLRYEKHAMVMQRFTSLSPKIQRSALAATQHLKEQCDAAARRLKLGLLA